jgi:hypothetical protein
MFKFTPIVRQQLNENKNSCHEQFIDDIIKEGLMTKNGPIDFAQSLAIFMKNPIRFMAKGKWEVALHFLAHKMHVKELS